MEPIFQPLENEVLNQNREFWDQEFISENKEVYRSSFLAFKIFKGIDVKELRSLTEDQLLKLVQEESAGNYSEGYIKGVHDLDASKILKVLVQKDSELGILKHRPEIRAFGRYFWEQLEEDAKKSYDNAIKASGQVLSYFPDTREYDFLIAELDQSIADFGQSSGLFPAEVSLEVANYLFEELQSDDRFTASPTAMQLSADFQAMLKKEKADQKFQSGLESIELYSARVKLVRQWLLAFIRSQDLPQLSAYIEEAVCMILFPQHQHESIQARPDALISGLKGDHPGINEGTYQFNYHHFTQRLQGYFNEQVPGFMAFREARHQVTEALKDQLKLEEFRPRVLTSFVRNKLINQVYFPLFGENLAKQLGSVGEGRRTDRMGMLLLVSPPGYGKTTLMEYISNRLGLVFMKINCPAIGHDVTSVDPEAATNSAAREELKKLNLAFEMGNNVMLYLDDIQHSSAEFLQKFISLADGTRKIEGVYNGKPKTYDLRGKKFCVVMAGNPYTESGEKFRIPDMLANRADIYNLGDIIGDTAHLFKLSLIENSLTSNPVLQQLRSRNFDDVYALLEAVENKSEITELQGNHTRQEIEDYRQVLEKVIAIRNIVLRVNEAYIRSAGMEDDYREEPAFKLQGSYRDMNKLVAKVVPIMNEQELQTLLLSHYENESQTLTMAAEANLLKFKELYGTISEDEQARWNSIKETFRKNNKLKGLGSQNEMAQLLSQLMAFGDHLEGIRNVLQEGLPRNQSE